MINNITKLKLTYILARIIFLLISFITVNSFADDNIPECRKIISESFQNNIARIKVSQDYFDAVDNLPEEVKKQFAFARFQVINHKVYGISYANKSDDFRVNGFVSILKNNLLRLPDSDYVVLIEDGIVVLDKELKDFNSILYGGSFFGNNFHKKDENYYLKVLILFPDFYAIDKDWNKKIVGIKRSYGKIPFDNKIPKLLFRGSSTGGTPSISNISSMPRMQTTLLSLIYSDYIDSRLTYLVQFNLDDNSSQNLHNSLLSLFGDPGQYFISLPDQMKYKYILSLDGNVAAWSRPQHIMFMDSALFYQTDYVQWFQDVMKPYFNYIPIKSDMTDVLTQIEWARNNPDKVQEIIANQNKTAHECFEYDQIQEQFTELLQLYSAKFNYKIKFKNFPEL